VTAEAADRSAVAQVATIDFHVTAECSQECPYCWGPQGFEEPVDTNTALAIIRRIRTVGARRIVFTGGDPLQRPDVGELIHGARAVGLEVALSTTGDRLDSEFLEANAGCLDLVSLPLDGSTEEVSCRTKEPGHYAAVMGALELLRAYPAIDVKVCTPVTRHNLADVPYILRLVEMYAETTAARVFYNVFQAFPRTMQEVEWEDLLVSAEEFAALRRELAKRRRVRVNWLDHETLDRLYVMVFPDGSLVVPQGTEYRSYGPFLDIVDLDDVLARSAFDSARHLAHSRGWSKNPELPVADRRARRG
jgi:MoaA/NifB/PqqE/SkfB family radical SAM enzyme